LYPFLALVPLVVAVALVTYVVRTSLKDGTGVPWIGAILVAILSLNGFGGIIAVVVWKNDHDDKVIRRRVQREAYAASRVMPHRPAGPTSASQPLVLDSSTASLAPISPMRAMSRLVNTRGLDVSNRAEQARVVDGIIDSILDLYPEHPNSQRIRATRAAREGGETG
jgi:hypothetical protein